MNTEDSIIEEVRKVRDEHSKKFNYDISKIVNDFKKKEKKHQSKIVSRVKKHHFKKASGSMWHY